MGLVGTNSTAVGNGSPGGRRHNYRIGAPLLAVLLVASVVTACGSSKAKSSSTPTTTSGSSSPGSTTPATSNSGKTSGGDYVIGVDDDLSGALAFYGQDGLQNDQAAVNYVNSHGGINGHAVKLVTADAAAAGSNASSAAVQLIETDHVAAIVGLTISDDCGAVAPLAAAHTTPEICISTPSDDLQPVNNYVFGINPLETQDVAPALSLIQNTLKLPSGSTFATIVEGDAGEQAFASAAGKELVKAGYKQVDSEVVPLTASSSASQVAKLVQAKPQVVLAGLIAPYYAAMIGSLRAAGNKAAVIATSGSVPYASFLTIKDPGLDSLETANPITSTSAPGAGLQQYLAALATVGRTTPAKINGTGGPVAYLGDQGLFAGLKACGYPCKGSALSAALNNVSLTAPGLVDGTYGWSSSLHVLFNNFSIWAYNPSSGSISAVASSLPIGPLSG
jgi:branched-chain amino acid transport system substrate-binding protein